MKLYKYLILISLSAFVILNSCKDAGVITELEGVNVNVTNSPAISNTQNSFSIAVKAELFNAALEYPINFDKQNFEMTLSIAELTSGNVSIQVFNDSKQMLYKGDFNSKISVAQTITLEEKPTKLKFVFNSLSASFSCLLTSK
ncbi:MAG: hypothetical protein CVV24_05865 [Ignavibacteriae bacterium HGW-Ignavibacteriae-3]|nr:MAG: hypothetical protein CVV24_05865 [Ignavibacteriae bacterium HGW-Ignavibacteriae-3]